MTTKSPASRQRGTAGDISAARKVRVFDIPFEEAYAMIKAGGKPPEHMANALYVEWHSDLSGRFLIESTNYRLEVSEPAWHFTAEEIAERARRTAEESNKAFAIEIRADGAEEEWDEFRCEELLRENDARGDNTAACSRNTSITPTVIGSLRTRWVGRGWRKLSMKRRRLPNRILTNFWRPTTSFPQKSSCRRQSLHARG